MTRKQFVLPDELTKRLTLAAKQQGKKEVDIVREALTEKLNQTNLLTAGDALLKLAELGKRLDIRLPADASLRHDDYLYGDSE